MQSIFHPKDADFHHRDMLKNPPISPLSGAGVFPTFQVLRWMTTHLSWRQASTPSARWSSETRPNVAGDFLPLGKRMSGLNYIIYYIPIYKHHKHWVIRLEKMNFFGKTAKIHILREPWPFRLVQQLDLWDVQPSLCTKVSSEFRSVRLPSTLMFLGPTRFLWDKSYGNPTV